MRLFLLVLLPIVAFADSTSSLSQINNSNLGSDFSINTDTTSSTSSKKTTSFTATNSLSVPPSQTTEGSNDKNLFKFIFTGNTDGFYDVPVTIGNQNMALRMDIVQNNVWVLDGETILDCKKVDNWWSLEESVYGSESTSYPASVTTQLEFWVTVCAESGSFVTKDVEVEDSQVDLANDEIVRIPYINAINVTGKVVTTNLSVINGQLQSLHVSNFSFIDANLSSAFTGGMGLAGNSGSNSGFLEALTNETDVWKSNSYSLYFNEFVDTHQPFAQVLLGVVDQKYYVGDFYQFNMLPNTGLRFPPSPLVTYDNNLANSMIIPSTQLNDIILVNELDGNSVSLKGNQADKYPVIFDSRTVFNFLPLDVVVNIAMQTNAFYNQEINRWLVECDTIRETQAIVKFQLGELNVVIPIEDLLVNATGSHKQLTFANGQSACYLNFLPTNHDYSTLGLSFLKSVYLAVDNVGGTIGIGASNQNLQVKASDYLPLNKSSSNFDENSYVNHNISSNSIASIDFVTSGSIPFATTFTYNNPLTLTYTPYEADVNSLNIPARFSGALIISNEVYVTGASVNNNGQGTKSLATSTSNTLWSQGQKVGVFYGILSLMLGISIL